MRNLIKIIMILLVSSFFSCLSQDDIYEKANTKVPGLIIVEYKTGSGVSEDGNTVDYSICLNRQPASDVNVNFIPDSELTINGSDEQCAITFTRNNWDDFQKIVIGAVDDNSWEEQHEGTISVTTSSLDEFFDGTYNEEFSIDISDNDGLDVQFTPNGPINADEGGPAVSYTIVLGKKPVIVDEVQILISPDSQVTADKTSLTFNTSNWESPQTVQVTAVDDAILEGYHMGFITHTCQIDVHSFVIKNLQVNITDNEYVLLTVTNPSPFIINENSVGGNYDIKLSADPAGSVTIDLSTNGQMNAVPSSLTFDSGNWGTYQNIIVTPINDNIAEGDHTGSIYHKISGINVLTIDAAIKDDDTAGISVNPDPFAITIAESGAGKTYRVRLSSEPVKDVIFNIEAPDGQFTFVTTPVTLPHTFNAANWNTSIEVFVTANDDMTPESDHQGTLINTTSSEDPNYDGLALSLPIDIIDNEICVSDDSIFVAAPDGGPSLPFKTIQDALLKAANIMAPSGQASSANVLVAANKTAPYSDSPVISIMAGVSLYGGYTYTTTPPCIWSRSIAENPTVISGSAPNTVSLAGTSTKESVLDGFIIRNNNTIATATAAVSVQSGSRSVIKNNIIAGGNSTTMNAVNMGIICSSGAGTITEVMIVNNIIMGGRMQNTVGVKLISSMGSIINNTIDGGYASSGCYARGIEISGGMDNTPDINIINNIIFNESGTKLTGVWVFAEPNDRPAIVSANAMFNCSNALYSVNDIKVSKNIDSLNSEFGSSPLNVDDSGMGTSIFESFATLNFHLKNSTPINIKFGGMDCFTHGFSDFSTDRDGVSRTDGFRFDPGNGGDGWSIGAYEQDE